MTAEPYPEPAPREVIVASDIWRAPPFEGDAATEIAIRAGDATAAEMRLPAAVGWAVLLADDATLQRLNADHRGKERATNVLSFPAFPPGAMPAAGHIGDIAIAAETVLAEALDAGKPALHHLAHMVSHGVAHLGGLDHGSDSEAEHMEAIEANALARIDLPDPYSSPGAAKADER